ncbi:MAG TPA: helix-turn-helix domain-containing protein [Edaphocola sp.]|nr:helix-turn-helix domain-containing protein [Edaphocola sp.]
METLKYKVIKSDKQYDEYCEILHNLDFSSKRKTKAIEEEMELLTFLIEKYDEEHNTFEDLDPIQILKSLMADHKMKAIDLAKILNVSTGLVSDILNYKKGLSKEVIRKLADVFKVSQEAFNRPYKLKVAENANRKFAL